MEQFRIFIASSTERIELATEIADALGKLGQEPVRWWMLFSPSSYTIESLEGALTGAEAGVFLCTGDDRGRIREQELAIARDNVILELGLFIAKLGRRRCFIVADSNRPLRMPTDLEGISTIRADMGPDNIASLVVKCMRESIRVGQRRADRRCIHVLADSNITAKVNAKELPVEWHQRALYCGTEGAKAWLAYADDEFNNVQTNKDRTLDQQQTVMALNGGRWRSYISLGPGDGRRDRYVYDKLRTLLTDVQYVPVDISEGLIHHATSALRETGAIVPFGVLGDFEDNQNFIFEQIDQALPRPRLIGLLGNTLGNLDGGDEKFLRGLQVHMQRGDELLLDVATAREPWEFDPYHKYFKSAVRRRFIAQGIARQLGRSPRDILAQFKKRIGATPTKAPQYAQQQTIYDKATQRVGLALRVYYFDKFRDWIARELQFDEKYAQEYSFEGTPSFGAGLIRLARR